MRDTFPAGLAVPSSAGCVSWAGGRWDWPQELKPFFSDLLLAIVIIGYMAYLVGEDVYVLTDDAKDWFHQFALATLQCWACGMFRLDPAAFGRGDLDAALAVVLARCLDMGVSPSSNIAQRTLTEMQRALSETFGTAEEPHLRALEARFPAFAEARDARRRLGVHTGRNESWCHLLLGYTDDLVAVLMGCAATVRYTATHSEHFGPRGCNVRMAIAAKRHLGVSIPFIGATALTVGQLAYVSRARRSRSPPRLPASWRWPSGSSSAGSSTTSSASCSCPTTACTASTTGWTPRARAASAQTSLSRLTPGASRRSRAGPGATR